MTPGCEVEQMRSVRQAGRGFGPIKALPAQTQRYLTDSCDPRRFFAVKRNDPGQNHFSFVARQRIEDGLCLTAGFHQAVAPETCQMLRQGGLAQANNFLQLTNAVLAFGQIGHNPETVGVTQRFQDNARPVQIFFNCFDRHFFLALLLWGRTLPPKTTGDDVETQPNAGLMMVL